MYATMFLLYELTVDETKSHIAEAAIYKVVGYAVTENEAELLCFRAGTVHFDEPGGCSWPWGYINNWPMMKYEPTQRIKP